MSAEPNQSDAEGAEPQQDAQPPIRDTEPVDKDLSELQQARKDRLARIKAQIDAGTYDSEELFDAALERMVRGIDLTNDESEEE